MADTGPTSSLAVEAPNNGFVVINTGEERRPNVPKVAVRACAACRQMKMKCEGAENPPCKRCLKVGRECVSQNSRLRASLELQDFTPRDESRLPPSHLHPHPDMPSNSIISINSLKDVQTVMGSPHNPRPRLPQPFISDYGSSSRSQTAPELPSIYATPPVDTLSEEHRYHNLPQSTPVTRKRKRHTENVSIRDTMSPASFSQREIIITKEEMKEMIHLFCQRHLPFIPALHYEDYENMDSLIQNELPFVYCICYITARYLPGGREIREMLLPEITRYPREIFAPRREGQVSDWIIFKGLIVLFSYADLTPPSQVAKSVAEQDITYWPLKYAVEVMALRHSLHRSIQDLRSDIETRSMSAPETITSYKKYTMWLWLFNMAHYCSIVSGTPPSIRIDYSIRAGIMVVDKLGQNPRLSTLFGIVELYMIWEEASEHHPQLGEWWCLTDPKDDVDENSVEAMIQTTNKALAMWRVRWDNYINFDDRGAFLEYHARYTQFCITSYAIKCVRSSPNVTPLQSDQIARCVESANHVIDWPLSRGPIQKDRLRYVDDSACIMISFCALFILSTCQAFPSCIPNISESLDNVTEAAQLMVDLAINSEQKPHIQGMSILKRADILKAALENARNNDNNRANFSAPADSLTPDTSALVFEGLESWFNDENFFGMEPIWHFPNVFSALN